MLYWEWRVGGGGEANLNVRNNTYKLFQISRNMVSSECLMDKVIHTLLKSRLKTAN